MPDDAVPQGACFVLDSTTQVQLEHVTKVFVNEEHTMTVVCSPDHLPELVLGRLFSEGIIDGAQEVDQVRVCEDGTQVRVTLSETQQIDLVPQQVENVPTTGAGSRVFRNSLHREKELPQLTPIPWDPQWVFDLSALLTRDTPMHKVTFGVHSCFLSHEGEVLYCCEDLGRHNAFDKVIGCALRDGVDLTQCVVFSSGRLPVDMVTKAIRARIPVLATKAVPTNRTIRLARQHNLTLICSAHPDKMVVMCDPANPL
ncbi:MAG: formate dehydrogenase accessory sulfurtransferase FdhD [Coriobacteriia bacterium]|nr:formate dehydrogenase accessory sulfurtransferase FdhD [Coriobacteriia bacterium]